jgi:AbrB family looped-hinge helix DNA binding protein
MMKSDYFRKLDSRGRINIPKRFRVAFDFEAGNEFRIFYENDLIIIKKEESKVKRPKYHQDEW